MMNNNPSNPISISNMDINNYTLEKHLEALCSNDNDYNVLLATWRLNKENLALALNTIIGDFPHFSRHDASHSSKILDNIQRLLGQDRIERLGATDTFLLLMSAMTHDLGMYLYYNVLEEQWKKDKMGDLLRDYAQHEDKTISKAARLLLDFKRCSKDPAQNYLWALEIRNAVTLIIAQQMRGGHEKRSAQYIEKDEDIINRLTHGFHFELLPSRYLTLLSKVAYLHGTNFDEVMKTLKQKADGYRGDYIHPRFIACMIRMGDLLDIDSNRFNDFASAKIKEVPESSVAHRDKHQAVKHLLISPEGIEAELDCRTDASYRVARQVFDWLEKEVEQLSRNWSRIAPKGLGGLPPVLHTDSINILYNGARTRPELMNLRFDISSKKTFEMLKGGAIYKKPGRVFLREIVQNALDATKLQIWKDMDIHLPFNKKEPDRSAGSHENSQSADDSSITHIPDNTIDSREKILFPDDIPADVYQKYPVSLKVEYDAESQSITVTCEDWGTGISEESLIRMTSQVGASRRADKDYEETLKNMPYFLQPTAAFGLGLQTVFYVADEFTVDTHYPGEPTRHIVFRTSTNGSYCSIEKEDIRFQRPWAGVQQRDVSHGTTVTIVIDKDHLGKLFELDEKEVEEFSHNPETIVSRIPTFIDNYAVETFQYIKDIPFNYSSPYRSYDVKHVDDKFKFLKKQDDFRLYWRMKEYDDNSGPCSFLIEERKYGSRMKIDFYNDGVPGDYRAREPQVSLRGIPTGWIDYGRLIKGYAAIDWDLCCREADKVLNLSRDGLLPQGEIWCNNTLESLLPFYVQLMHKVLLDCYNKERDEIIKKKLLNQYASLCMLNWQLPQPIEVDHSPLNEHIITKSSYVDGEYPLVVDNEGNPTNTKRLIELETFVYLGSHESYYFIRGIKNKEYGYKFKKGDIVVSREIAIPDTFICSETFFINGIPCCRLVKRDSSVPQTVSVSRSYIRRIEVFGWYAIEGLKGYDEIVVSKEAPLLGFKRPFHGNCWIYPVHEHREIIEEMPGSRVEADKYLHEKGRIKSLVPKYIKELVLKYSDELKKKDLKVEEKEEIIYETYIRLILDIKFGVEENKE